MSDAFLQVRDLKVHFPVRTGGVLISQYSPLKAVDGVSFDLNPGETLGVVGESGCGKSTLGRAVLQLISSSRPPPREGLRDDNRLPFGLRSSAKNANALGGIEGFQEQ